MRRTNHPNIDISNFELCNDKQEYYLASSRLVAYKKIDTIIEAFNQMPDKKLEMSMLGWIVVAFLLYVFLIRWPT